jgi:mRNA interferase MazF
VQVVPLTRAIRTSTTEVLIDPDENNRLAARSSAQCQHVRSVATTRIHERTGNVGPVILTEVRETLALLLDL